MGDEVCMVKIAVFLAKIKSNQFIKNLLSKWPLHLKGHYR
ncbi:hypothetical protein AALB_3792 [Agarivorans albus MKT 106]|uniref:Uncharacterized protein n=1 Tax=Agarivorans albus MKT 106 TaxID=1331007 RepID=R9PQP2_AGAAL|nr:hypothetical protein AALB_3792 [Agarivorans albus MKT 106]